MASFNRIIIMGNLTRDPECKALGDKLMCKFTLASSRKIKDKDETCFVDVDVWGNQAVNCQQYITKGKSVLVEGRLKQDSWEKDGKRQTKHSIVADSVTFMSQPTQGVSITQGATIISKLPSSDSSDDLPF